MRIIVLLSVVWISLAGYGQTIYRRGSLPFVFTGDSALTSDYLYAPLGDSDQVSLSLIGTAYTSFLTGNSGSQVNPSFSIYPTVGLKSGRLRAEGYIGINYLPRKEIRFEQVNPRSAFIKDPTLKLFTAQIGGIAKYDLGEHFEVAAGFDKNFIGEGYYSLFLSDNAGNNPFLRASTHFGKLSYSILYSYYNNINSYQTANQFQTNKFASIHVLSYKPTNWLEIQVYEAVIWQARDSVNRRGFDVNYLNPIVFFRPIEFNTGSADNAMIGAGINIKPTKNLKLYSQVLLDEFLLRELKAGNGWWANKFGIQGGAKWFNAFGVENLSLLGEINVVRPFTYSHQTNNINFGHNYAPLAHAWGSNFYQGVFLAQWVKGKHRFNVQIQAGQKGFDTSDTISNGGNVFKPYALRGRDYQHNIAQGATTTIINASTLYAYRIDKKHDLELFINPVFYRYGTQNQVECRIGIRTPFFNSYTNY